MNKKNKNSNLPLGDLIKLGSKSRVNPKKLSVKSVKHEIHPKTTSSRQSNKINSHSRFSNYFKTNINKISIQKQIISTIKQIIAKCDYPLSENTNINKELNNFHLTDLVLDLLQYISDEIANFSNIISIVLATSLKSDPNVFKNKEIIALCSIVLKNFSDLIQKSKEQLFYEQSFISLLLIAFQDSPQWPVEFFESYLYDTLNYRQDLKWSTDPVNHTFVENIKTAFLSTACKQDCFSRPSTFLTCNELLNEEIESSILPRYSCKVIEISQVFKKVLSNQNLTQTSENLEDILNLCYKTENIRSCKIVCLDIFEMLIQHPKNLKEAQDLLVFILKDTHNKKCQFEEDYENFCEEFVQKLLNIKFKNRSSFQMIIQTIIGHINSNQTLLLTIMTKVILERDLVLQPFSTMILQEFSKKFSENFIMSVSKFFSSHIILYKQKDDEFTKLVMVLRDINKICRSDLRLEDLYECILEDLSDSSCDICETVSFLNNNFILLHINSSIKDELNNIDINNKTIRLHSNLGKFLQTYNKSFSITIAFFAKIYLKQYKIKQDENDQLLIYKALEDIIEFKLNNTENWRPEFEINLLKQIFTSKMSLPIATINSICPLMNSFSYKYRIMCLEMIKRHFISVHKSNYCFIIENNDSECISSDNFLLQYFELLSYENKDLHSQDTFSLIYKSFWLLTEILLYIGLDENNVSKNGKTSTFRTILVNKLPHIPIILQSFIYKNPMQLKLMIDNKKQNLFPEMNIFFSKFCSMDVSLYSHDPGILLSVNNLMKPPLDFIDSLEIIDKHKDISFYYLSGASTKLLDFIFDDLSYNFIETKALKFDWLKR